MTEQPKDGGAAFDLAQMIADREAGTPGEWVSQSRPNFGSGYIYTSVLPVTPDPVSMDHLLMMSGEYHVCRMTHTPMPEKARKFAVDARRIARVPLLESEIIRMTARVERLEGALRPFSEIGVGSNPDYHPQIRLDRDAIMKARAALSTPTEDQPK